MTVQSRLDLSEHLRNWRCAITKKADPPASLLAIKSRLYNNFSSLTGPKIREIMKEVHYSDEFKGFAVKKLDEINRFVNYLIDNQSSPGLFESLIDLLCDVSVADELQKVSFFSAYPPTIAELRCPGGTSARLQLYKEQLASSGQFSLIKDSYDATCLQMLKMVEEEGFDIGNEPHFEASLRILTNQGSVSDIVRKDKYAALPLKFMSSGAVFELPDRFNDLYRQKIKTAIERQANEKAKDCFKEIDIDVIRDIFRIIGVDNLKKYGIDKDIADIDIDDIDSLDLSNFPSITFHDDNGAIFDALYEFVMNANDINERKDQPQLYFRTNDEDGTYSLDIKKLISDLVADEIANTKYSDLNLGRTEADDHVARISASDIYSHEISDKITDLLKPAMSGEAVKDLHARWSYAIDILYSMCQSSSSKGGLANHFLKIVRDENIQVRLNEIYDKSYLNDYIKEKIKNHRADMSRLPSVNESELGILQLYDIRSKAIRRGNLVFYDATEDFLPSVQSDLSELGVLDEYTYEVIVKRLDYKVILDQAGAIKKCHIPHLLKAAIKVDNIGALEYLIDHRDAVITPLDIFQIKDKVLHGAPDKMLCIAIKKAKKSFKKNFNTISEIPFFMYDLISSGNKNAVETIIDECPNIKNIGILDASHNRLNLLNIAVNFGNVEIVEKLLKSFPRYFNINSAMNLAAQVGSLNVVRYFTKTGWRNNSSVAKSMIKVAAENRQTDVVKHLLLSGVEPKMRSSHNITDLDWLYISAAMPGDVEFIIDRGIKIKNLLIDFTSLTKIALQRGNYKITDKILEHNYEDGKLAFLDLNKDRASKIMSECFASESRRNLCLALIESGAPLDRHLVTTQELFLQRLLVDAIIDGKIKAAEILINSGLRLAFTMDGQMDRSTRVENANMLHFAAYYGHISIAQLLADKHPSLLIEKTILGSLPLHFAAISSKSNSNDHSLMLFFLEKYNELREDINSENVNGKMPLSCAVERCRVDSVKNLLLHGAKSGAALLGRSLEVADPSNDRMLTSLYLLCSQRELNERNKLLFIKLMAAVKGHGEEIDYRSLMAIAIKSNNFTAMEVLLKDNYEVAKSNILLLDRSDIRKIPIEILTKEPKKSHLCMALIEAGADLNKVSVEKHDKFFHILLYDAIKDGKIEVAKALINSDLNLNIPYRAILERGVNISGASILHIAAYYDRVTIAQLLIDKYPDMLKSKTKAESVPLHLAAISEKRDSSEVSMIQLLVEKSHEVAQDIDAVNKMHKTPLRYAAEKGNSDYVKNLLLGGAEVYNSIIDQAKKISRLPTSSDKNIITLLNLYSAKSETPFSNLQDLSNLLDDIKESDLEIDHQSLVRIAMKNNNYESAEAILKDNYELSKHAIACFDKDEIAKIPLELTLRADKKYLYMALIESGLDFTTQLMQEENRDFFRGLLTDAYDNNRSEIIKAILSYDPHLAKFVITNNHDIRLADFYFAVAQGNVEKLNSILIDPEFNRYVKQGVDKDALLKIIQSSGNKDISTLFLNLATEEDDKFFAKKLLDLGKEVVDADHTGSVDGATALHIAVSKGYKDLAEILIGAGVNIDKSRSIDGATALHIAVSKGYKDLARILIDVGANTDKIRSIDGATALHIAVSKKDEDTVGRLIDAKANVNAKGVIRQSDGGVVFSETALHIAANKGYDNIVRQLLDANANPYIERESDHKTADEIIRSREGLGKMKLYDAKQGKAFNLAVIELRDKLEKALGLKRQGRLSGKKVSSSEKIKKIMDAVHDVTEGDNTASDIKTDAITKGGNLIQRANEKGNLTGDIVDALTSHNKDLATNLTLIQKERPSSRGVGIVNPIVDIDTLEETPFIAWDKSEKIPAMRRVYNPSHEAEKVRIQESAYIPGSIPELEGDEYGLDRQEARHGNLGAEPGKMIFRGSGGRVRVISQNSEL